MLHRPADPAPSFSKLPGGVTPPRPPPIRPARSATSSRVGRLRRHGWLTLPRAAESEGCADTAGSRCCEQQNRKVAPTRLAHAAASSRVGKVAPTRPVHSAASSRVGGLGPHGRLTLPRAAESEGCAERPAHAAASSRVGRLGRHGWLTLPRAAESEGCVDMAARSASNRGPEVFADTAGPLLPRAGRKWL